MISTASTASLKECAVRFTVSNVNHRGEGGISNVRGNKFFLDVVAVLFIVSHIGFLVLQSVFPNVAFGGNIFHRVTNYLKNS
mgnify:CR=1 FL=1